MRELRVVEREIAGVLIFSSDDKLLLGRTNAYASFWVIPGGGVEEGETYEEAARREALEETGIDLQDEALQEVPGERRGESEKTLRDTGERVMLKMRFHDFKVVLAQEAALIPVQADDDFTDPWWAPVEELPNLRLSPPATEALQIMGHL